VIPGYPFAVAILPERGGEVKRVVQGWASACLGRGGWPFYRV